jgi:hypothetical protein
MKQLAGIVLGIFLLWGGARAAHASGYGYVCSMYDYTPNFVGYGNYGGVIVNVYSGPSCTGNYVTSGYICSLGATLTPCNGSWLRDELQMLSMSTKLQQAASANERIFFQTDSGGYLYNFLFYAGGY